MSDDIYPDILRLQPEAEGTTTTTKIKHLVLAGGGTSGLVAFGALKAMAQQGLWSYEDVVSIDATSAGTILAVIVALNYAWEDAEAYIVKRPWQHVVKSDIYSIFAAFDQRGIWNMEVIEQVLTPLLLGKNLSKTTTLQELFDATHIEIHFYAVALKSKCELVDISHLTHPDWRVVEAVYASSCVPVLFAPLFKDGIGYVDGGMLLNYPIVPCLERPGVEEQSVLGLNKKVEEVDPVAPSASLFDYIMYLLNQLIGLSLHRQSQFQSRSKIQLELQVTSRVVTSMDILQLSTSEELRQTLINEGMALASAQDCRSCNLPDLVQDCSSCNLPDIKPQTEEV